MQGSLIHAGYIPSADAHHLHQLMGFDVCGIHTFGTYQWRDVCREDELFQAL
jgi:hypothetical protein